MDAVTVAVVDVAEGGERDDVELVAFEEYPYDERVRRDLLALADAEEVALREVSRLNAVVSEEFAAAAERFVEETGFSFDDVDVIGTYGQTLGHYPTDAPPSTLQLGEPSGSRRRRASTRSRTSSAGTSPRAGSARR